jgi:hypothetical protein
MTSRIHDIRIDQLRLDPAEAELAVAIDVDPAVEVRGRWVGPSCAGRSTVDVAYPLRAAGSAYRVVIPEPALWDPASPFLYSGIIEVWQDGRRIERTTTEHGLRTAALTSKGWLWNHKPLQVRGVIRETLSEADASQLKDQGVNLILANRTDPALWQTAQRLGLLVLGRLEGFAAFSVARQCPTVTLGWLVRPSGSEAPRAWSELLRLAAASGQRAFLGTEHVDPNLPPEIAFLVQQEGDRLVLWSRTSIRWPIANGRAVTLPSSWRGWFRVPGGSASIGNRTIRPTFSSSLAPAARSWVAMSTNIKALSSSRPGVSTVALSPGPRKAMVTFA